MPLAHEICVIRFSQSQAIIVVAQALHWYNIGNRRIASAAGFVFDIEAKLRTVGSGSPFVTASRHGSKPIRLV
jgi:hypothetical protein